MLICLRTKDSTTRLRCVHAASLSLSVLLMEHAWQNAALATALISSAPTLVLPFIPQSATKAGSSLQRLLLCFAVGGMMGDVFLHLLPHLFMGGEHDHNHTHDHHHADSPHEGHHHSDETSPHTHQYDANESEGGGHGHGLSDLLVPIMVLAGFLLFFVSERVARGLVGGNGPAGHSHTHNNGGHASSATPHETAEDIARRKKNDDHVASSSNESCSTGIDSKKNGSVLKVAGILNLAADSLHNLTDGIAIGAAFASGTGLGYTTALATLMHELPHEIGDFAVLVQSGMSKWQAIGAQFATATAAFAGTIIGLLATSYAGLEKFLLAGTAGGFVYVSCVAVMPDILNASPSFLQATGEIAAMCCGMALMAGVALLE